MIKSHATWRSTAALFAASSFISIGSLWAADTPATSPAPSKEMREKMAQAHEKMAGCLRSDRAVAECRMEMMQTCRETLKDQGCGMMMGHGMMRDQGAKAPTQEHHTGK